jgi:hypothetical protein
VRYLRRLIHAGTLIASIAACISASGVVFALESADASSEAPVAFVDDDPLEAEIAEPSSGTTTAGLGVAVRNDTAEEVTPQFALILAKLPPDAITVEPAEPVVMMPGSASWIELTVTKHRATGAASGYISVSGAGGRPSLAPIVLSEPAGAPSRAPLYIVIGALGLSILVISTLLFRHRHVLAKEMGPVKFFEPSPGGLLAIGGGIAGAVAGLLPAETSVVPKDVLVALAALFAILFVLAPVIYQVFTRVEATSGTDLQEVGPVWAFVIVVGIFVAAIFGQLLTILALFGDAIISGSSLGLIGIAGAMAIIAAVVVSLYGIRWANASIEYRDHKPPTLANHELFSGLARQAAEPRRAWRPL